MGDLSGFEALPKESKKNYLKTWMSFISIYKISVNKPPTEKDIYDFLEVKLKSGAQRNTVRSYFSHLNLACQELYKIGVEKLNSFDYFISKSSKGDELIDNDWMGVAATSGNPIKEDGTRNLIAPLLQPSVDSIGKLNFFSNSFI